MKLRFTQEIAVVTASAPARRHGSYGIDAPYLLPIPAALVIANIVHGIISGTVWPFVAAAAVTACMGMRAVRVPSR